jgi:hypothetical protein
MRPSPIPLNKSAGQRQTGLCQLLGELGTDPGGDDAADHLPVPVDPALQEAEDVLHRDDVTLHPHDLGHLGDPWVPSLRRLSR